MEPCPPSSYSLSHVNPEISKMSSFEANPSEGNSAAWARLLGRQRPIHNVLGGGLVADILLWRNPQVSTIILIGITIIWLLFEVIEYSFVSLMCHISITIMLGFFIWRTLAELFKWKLPKMPVIVLQESTISNIILALHGKFNYFLSTLIDIACGKDFTTFFLVIGSLLMLSIIGNSVSSMNLLFTSYICGQILPYIYEKYEEDIDYFAGQIHQEMKQIYKKLEEKVIMKIPRVPSYDRKIR